MSCNPRTCATIIGHVRLIVFHRCFLSCFPHMSTLLVAHQCPLECLPRTAAELLSTDVLSASYQRLSPWLFPTNVPRAASPLYPLHFLPTVIRLIVFQRCPLSGSRRCSLCFWPTDAHLIVLHRCSLSGFFHADIRLIVFHRCALTFFPQMSFCF